MSTTPLLRSLPAALIVCFCFITRSAAAGLSFDTVNEAAFEASANGSGERSATMLKAQVLLDRAHISPGAIDGIAGENTSRAIKAFEELHGFKPDGLLDETAWQELAKDAGPVLKRYELSPDDVHGPFLDRVPDSLEAMSKLDRLSYTSPLELLAEKFHMDQDLLKTLNTGVDFSKAGTSIIVAAVREHAPDASVARVEADKSREAVIAYDADGRLVAYYPATIGSRSLPSPSGETHVLHVVQNPKYYYSPDLDFRGAPDKTLTISAGPNNPVGTVWIDLDKEGYGVHGTPDPEEIGKESSHGCVRLSNWDVQELARLVKKGTPIDFVEKGRSLGGKSRS
jgi:lipoprotein-anchoring transpeptidase ErfK/SrfK